MCITIAFEKQLQEERFISLIIVDFNKREINLKVIPYPVLTCKMVQYELVLELREFLNEHVYTCFFTHYYFEHMGKRLNDYTELAELDLQADAHLFMKPGNFKL